MPKVGAGSCGSCAGNPNANEPQQAAGQPSDGRSPAELAAMRRQVAEKVREMASQGSGKAPGGWARWADELLGAPKVRWQDKLARACRRAVSFKSGAVDYSYSRQSRRQGVLGTGDGIPILAALRQPVPRVAVALDTSGSMGTAELQVALAETKGILQATGANLTFMSCDTQVNAVGTVRRWQDAVKLVKGGGGTDFRPVFDKLAKSGAKRPDLLIFVTDGQGPAPARDPGYAHTIWLLVGPYARPPCTWGESIVVPQNP
jgi:predicted metal-dependent peptidase